MTFKVKTKGQNEGEKLLVPKLRFKEFKDEWKTYNLKQVLEIKNGLNKEKESFGTGTPIINYMDVNKHTILTSDKIKGLVKLSKKEIDNFKVNKGDIFFTRTSETSAEIGLSSSLIEDIENCVFSGFILKATPKKNIFNNLFSGYYFRTYKLRKEIIKHSSITTRALTSGSLLYGMNINIPNIDEQEKIGKTLYLLDKKIELQQRKIDTLKIYKKGLLYKTFIKCCANCKIKDLLILGKSGGTPKSTNADYYDGNIPFLSITDMTSQGKYIKQTEKHISNLGLENSSAWLLPVNTLILSMYASYGLVSINKISLSTSQAMFNMIFKENINVEYIYYYLNYLKETHFYEELVSTGTQSNLNADKVKNIPIYLPNKTEQTRISSLFNVLDNKIELQESNLNSLIMLKKSLLQQMFI